MERIEQRIATRIEERARAITSVAPPITVDYWVGPTGLAGNAGTYADPWNAESLPSRNFSPGDVIGFKDGVYNPTGGDWNTPSIYITDSGTPGNPITLISETPRGAELVGPGTTSGAANGQQGLIGVNVSNPVSYVVFDGFKVHNCWAKAVAIMGGSFVTFQNSEIYDVGKEDGDNNECFRIEDTDNVTIQNCLIYDFTNGFVSGQNHNGAGIKVYTSRNLIVQQCEFTQVSRTGFACAIFDKIGLSSGDSSNTYRRNYIHNVGQAFRLHSNAGSPNNNSAFYQNVIVGGTAGVIRVEENWMDAGKKASIYNNTLVNPAGQTAGVGIYKHLQLTEGQDPAPGLYTIVDYNDWPADLFVTLGDFSAGEENYNGLASWKTNPHGFAAGSISVNPDFIGGQAPDSYRLNSGSPCVNAGRIGGIPAGSPVNMGAYITGTEQIGKDW